ncbi:hypothetical protein SELSPUOL_02188 [Selenomonas sputigena ATCC 35185]|uniref:Uncharacterized protein n=1 Tax=Selenomonas sputigena (strain ATCC 35185 / DSM 20758 / CCUG 44933 / VPI D19B-28) TaxID=546271 RepID=C9LXI0_SELS3|nr:hypothetical protein SELSPUOL_02188 [Selenomonas sputigena ATCC 35185]
MEGRFGAFGLKPHGAFCCSVRRRGRGGGVMPWSCRAFRLAGS